MKPTKPATPAHKLLPLTIALLSAFHGAQADEANKESALDPVVVTAQRGKDTNTVVRASRMEVEQALSLQDLFKQMPEVNISGGALSTVQKVYVRGLSERMLNVTIDGASQPEAAFHHNGQIMIEPELLKRVEVEAGTGAATAGPGALAGALRFTTKSANDLLRPGEKFGAFLKQSYQSNADGNKTSGTVYGRLSEQIDVLASLTSLDAGEYVDGHGNRVQNSATEAKAGFIKLGFTPAQGHRLELAHDRHEDEGLRSFRANLLPTAFNASQRQKAERESTTLNYNYKPGNALVDLHVVTFLNDNALTMAKGGPAQEDVGTRSHGLNISNVSRLGDHKLTYGFDYRHDKGYSALAGAGSPDETASVKGAYLQDDLALTDQWLLGLGGRYDQYDYKDIDGRQSDAKGFSPSASLAFKPVSSVTLRLSHARALRGVWVIEPFLKPRWETAPNLAPEKASNSEFSAAWQEGPWQVNGAVFQQRINNFISFGEDFRENVGDVRSRGYSLSAGYKAAQWSASLGLAESKPQLNGQPLADGDSLLLGTTSGRNWVAQVDYQLPGHNLKFGWTGRLVEKLTNVPAGTGAKPGYNVHDIYTQWQPLGDKLSLTLTIKNLFDQYYYDQTSFGYNARWGTVASLPEAGRDVRVSASWKF